MHVMAFLAVLQCLGRSPITAVLAGNHNGFPITMTVIGKTLLSRICHDNNGSTSVIKLHTWQHNCAIYIDKAS